MKIIKIIFFSLLGLCLIASTVIFIFFEVFDTDQLLPQITKKASLIIGRTVSIGHVGFGLSSRGITVDAWPLIIADDPGFTAQPFVKIDQIRLSLDLKALILKRVIHITDILLQSPQIHFIRSQEGELNFQGHDRPIMADSKGAATPEGARNPVEKKLPDGDIKSIRIQDGSISYIDQSQNMPLDIWLNNINTSLNDFSPSQSFQLFFDASPLVFKSISPGKPDSPIFKIMTGQVQFNKDCLRGDIILADGVFKNFNIIKEVLSRAAGNLGGIDSILDNLLSGQLKGKLSAADTAVEKAEVKFTCHDKAVFIEDSLIKTDIFELTAKGSIDEAHNVDMQTMLHFNEDVSLSLVNGLDGLKYLMDDTKRIAIDASLTGDIAHPKYKPSKDFRKKSKKALIEEGRNILGVLLGGR